MTMSIVEVEEGLEMLDGVIMVEMEKKVLHFESVSNQITLMVVNILVLSCMAHRKGVTISH